MRYIIQSSTCGTFIGSTYGGEFFSAYGGSTYSDDATTFASEEEARSYAARVFSVEDELGELEVLAVETDAEGATMQQCIEAGAAPWPHHVARGPREPRNKPLTLPKSLFFGHPGHGAKSWAASVLPDFVRKDGTAFAIDREASHQVVFAPPAVGASLLVHMTADEVLALNQWCADQPAGPSVGAVDLMRWPGWQEVARRRASAKRVFLPEAE